MHNWSTDEKIIAGDEERYTLWKLQQMANFGLCGERLKEEQLRKHWPKLNIDPARLRFLELLLHAK